MLRQLRGFEESSTDAGPSRRERDMKEYFSNAMSSLQDPYLTTVARESWMDNLLEGILSFLSSCTDDLDRITTEYSELGQIIKRLNEEPQVLTSEKLYNKLLKCIMWFYRKNPANLIEAKVSHWAQNLLQRAVICPLRKISSIYSPAESVVYPQLKAEHFNKLFQNSLLTCIRTMKPSDVQIRLDWMSKCGLVVLNLPEPNVELLEVLVDVLPVSHNDFYDVLSSRIDGVTKDKDISSRLFIRAARKEPRVLENKVVELLSKWTDLWPNEVTDFDCFERNSIIECVSDDEKTFQTLITVLHSALVRLQYHEAILDFIQWMLRQEQQFFSLYPSHLRSLAYLMDIPDLSGLDDRLRCEHVLGILDALLAAVESTSVEAHEVQMLVSHFPVWWNHLKRIYLSDENVRVKVWLLVCFFSGQPVFKLMQNETFMV